LAPGRTAYAPITLSRGVDADTTFEDWANAVFELSDQGVASGGQNFRKSVRIELLDEAGQLVLAYDVFNAWVSQYTALPDLNSSANAIAIEEITLEHDGWARDTSVVPPAQTS
jgi:phage tail-like protein